MNLIDTIKENTIKAQNAKLDIMMLTPEIPEPIIMPDWDRRYPEKMKENNEGTSD